MKLHLCLNSMSLLVLLISLPAGSQVLYYVINSTELTCPAHDAVSQEAIQPTIQGKRQQNSQHFFLLQQTSFSERKPTGQCLYSDTYCIDDHYPGSHFPQAIAGAATSLASAFKFNDQRLGAVGLGLLFIAFLPAQPKAKKGLSFKDCPAQTGIDKIPQGFVWKAFMPGEKKVCVEAVDDLNTLSGRCIQSLDKHILLCDKAITDELLAAGIKCFTYGSHDLNHYFIPDQRGAQGSVTFDYIYLDNDQNTVVEAVDP